MATSAQVPWTFQYCKWKFWVHSEYPKWNHSQMNSNALTKDLRKDFPLKWKFNRIWENDFFLNFKFSCWLFSSLKSLEYMARNTSCLCWIHKLFSIFFGIRYVFYLKQALSAILYLEKMLAGTFVLGDFLGVWNSYSVTCCWWSEWIFLSSPHSNEQQKAVGIKKYKNSNKNPTKTRRQHKYLLFQI